MTGKTQRRDNLRQNANRSDDGCRRRWNYGWTTKRRLEKLNTRSLAKSRSSIITATTLSSLTYQSSNASCLLILFGIIRRRRVLLENSREITNVLFL